MIWGSLIMRYSKKMPKSSGVRWGLLLLALASVYFLVAYVLQADPATSQSDSSSGTCVQSQHQLIAGGHSPAGKPWTITGTIRNNGGCNDWLFGMEFSPAGASAGSWRGAWGIPAAGHLSDNFTISARDESEGSERAFSGAAGVRVKTVMLTTSNGERLTIHPKLPPNRLRKRFVWLRNVRYFMRYYPTGQHAKVAKLFDSRGKLIYVVQGQEGGFDGPM